MSAPVPVISIIIPVFNGATTLPGTLKSVFCQTFTEFEILLINDGSTDHTVEVVDTFSDPRLRILSYENSGVAVSRNRGVKLAQGKYLAFLDADDLWSPDKLTDQLQALKNHPEAALAYSWTDYIDTDGKLVNPGDHPTEQGVVYSQLLLKNFIENGSNPLIRASSLQQVGLFDPDLPPAEDWDLWLRIAARYAFVVVPKVQVFYRIYPGGSSANVDKMERQCLRVVQRACETASPEVAALREASLSNLYFYFTLRTIAGQWSRPKGWRGLKYLIKAIGYDRSLLSRRTRLVSILIAKGLTMIVWPGLQPQGS